MKRTIEKALIILLFSVLCLVQLPSAALAQEEAPILFSTADYTFGQQMEFRLSAKNIPDVESVTLYFRAPEFENTYAVEVPFEVGDRLRAAHSLDLSQVRLAPFTRVTYWWLLTDKSGQELAVPEQIIPYDDNRFEWRQASRSGVTAYWTNGDAGMGQLALDTVEQTYARLRSIYPAFEPQPFQLFIYPSTADLRSALRLTGRDWVGAHADPKLGVVLVTAVNARSAAADLGWSIPHEMAHLLLYHAVGQGYEDVPAWFSEGVATYVETTVRTEYAVRLQEDIQAGTTIPFAELCETFPAAHDRAILAYAQSDSLIRYIQSHYGNQKVSDLIRAYADGAGCESGVSRVLKLSLAELEASWLREQRPRSALLEFLSENGLWILLIAGGFGASQLLIIGQPRRAKDERAAANRRTAR